jgi:hypothetical protein
MDTSINMLDINHILVEGIELDLLECIKPYLHSMFRNAAGLFERLDQNFSKQEYICGERSLKKGIFSLRWNNWKEIHSIILDLPYNLKGIDDSLIEVFVLCNEVHNMLFHKDQWTTKDINDFLILAKK